MNNTLRTIGAIVILGLVVVGLYLWLSKAPSNPTKNGTATTTFPLTGETPDSNIGTLDLPAEDGGTVSAKDIKTDPTTVEDPINHGYYYLGYHVPEGVPDPTATENPPYLIQYIEETHYFNIALLAEPIGETRHEAEQYLLAHLGVSQAELCKLQYMVSVPFWINPIYAGENLGFSFCPGAVKLPN